MSRPYWNLLVGLVFTLLAAGTLPALADEKEGMPDLIQVENTCLPTSVANLLIWFGKHGYPKLIIPAATEDESIDRTVHEIMNNTNARFDWGTSMDGVTDGIKKYIQDAGYDCDIECRGYGGNWHAFSPDWLTGNDDPNKGFILLLSYGHYNKWELHFTRELQTGHAVTLVNAEADTLLIHDPAHETESGRKLVTIVSPQLSGISLLTGSRLEAPDNDDVELDGAICITMHPVPSIGSSSKNNMASKGKTVGGATPGAAPADSGDSSWAGWFLNLFFGK